MSLITRNKNVVSAMNKTISPIKIPIQKKLFLFSIVCEIAIIVGTNIIAPIIGYSNATKISNGSSSTPDVYVTITVGIKTIMEIILAKIIIFFEI